MTAICSILEVILSPNRYYCFDRHKLEDRSSVAYVPSRTPNRHVHVNEATVTARHRPAIKEVQI